MHMSRWSLPSRTSNKCLKIANYWWQYNDHAHDLLTFTYMFLLKPTFYDIWFICNCILMAIILTWCLFICHVSSCPPLMGGRQSEFAMSRSHAHIAIGSFRLHRMYTQLPILSIYIFILQWQHLPTNIACLIYFLILVSYKYNIFLYWSVINRTYKCKTGHIGGYCFQIHTQNYFKYVYSARNAGKGSAKPRLFPRF
jgi:hypothetical protein